MWIEDLKEQKNLKNWTLLRQELPKTYKLDESNIKMTVGIDILYFQRHEDIDIEMFMDDLRKKSKEEHGLSPIEVFEHKSKKVNLIVVSTIGLLEKGEIHCYLQESIPFHK